MAGKTYKRTEIQAFGKINFSLNVTGIDSRKYHLLESVMQTVPVCDTVTVTSTLKGGVPPKNVTLPYKLPLAVTSDMRDLPCDSRNTAYRAAEKMIRLYPRILGAHEDIVVNIRKKIPVGGGLGGSSADCAAVIKAFDTHFGLGLTDNEMIDIGASLGSDVPFMIKGGTALVTGTGEVVTQLEPPKGIYVLVCNPGYGMDTWEVYRKYDNIAIDDGSRPDTEAIVNALRAGDRDGFIHGLKNVLEAPAFVIRKELETFKARLEKTGAQKVLMSGSGSSFFCIFTKESELRKAMAELSTESVEYFYFKM
jgi:4-diphosphocytidyl-2-C-methyl-D-erythritol kinase